MSDSRLVPALRMLEEALANAISDGIVPAAQANVLRFRCIRYRNRLSSFGWWDSSAAMTLVMRTLNYLRKERSLLKAHEHIENCLGFLQDSIDKGAAVLVEDVGLDDRINATIAMLEAASEPEGSDPQ